MLAVVIVVMLRSTSTGRARQLGLRVRERRRRYSLLTQSVQSIHDEGRQDSMKIQIFYATDHVVDVVTADTLSDKDVQDFLYGKLIIHGADAEGRLLAYGGRNALWVARTADPQEDTA